MEFWIWVRGGFLVLLTQHFLYIWPSGPKVILHFCFKIFINRELMNIAVLRS